jgi:riboflavin synthase
VSCRARPGIHTLARKPKTVIKEEGCSFLLTLFASVPPGSRLGGRDDKERVSCRARPGIHTLARKPDTVIKEDGCCFLIDGIRMRRVWIPALGRDDSAVSQ